MSIRIVFYLGVFLLGALSWAFISPLVFEDSSEIVLLREPAGKYRYIKPLLGFNLGEKKEFDEYTNLESQLTREIDRFVKEKKIASASVYFREMENGHWTGVNEDDLYSPASLYKVALMIAVLKHAESNPSILDEKIVFEGSRLLEKPDNPPMVIGQSYTMRDLLSRLIVLSDNDARDLLRSRLNPKSVGDVFYDLGLTEPGPQDTGDSMSARAYSRFFRALYNATYLNRSYSEYALDLLSKTEFNSGLVNGLPEKARTLVVAHKFGHRIFPEPVNGISRELHDCGIIYYPNKPYFLCIMTKGTTVENLYEVIQAVSRIVYEETAS